MTFHSRMRNARNEHQGNFKRVLCVCSAGLLRSPTAAFILSQPPFEFNARAVGCEDYAMISLEKIQIRWADDIICFDQGHMNKVSEMLEEMPYGDSPRLFCVDTPDKFAYRDHELVNHLTNKFKELYGISDGGE